jgi:hypothetical protein
VKLRTSTPPERGVRSKGEVKRLLRGPLVSASRSTSAGVSVRRMDVENEESFCVSPSIKKASWRLAQK